MKIAIPIDVDAIVDHLPMREKIRLVQRLERETWASRLDWLFNRTNQRRGRRNISEKEILRICKDVRRKLHDSGRS